MTISKKLEEKKELSIKIDRSRVGGKKKIDLFARLRTDDHPLDRILPVDEDSSVTVLPSTNSESERPQVESNAVHIIQNMPSTFNLSERPQVESSAVHNKTSSPSTHLLNERPQIQIMPSTSGNVDVLPSTLENTATEKECVDGKTSTHLKPAVHTNKLTPSTKGDRHNKFLKRYDNRIAPNIKQGIDVFCAEFDMSQRDFAEQSAVHFIEMWTAKLSKNVDGKTAHDDRSMMMFKVEPIIINLYRAYNPENKWKFKDDDVAVKYNLTDIRLIEIGIIETQFNSNFKKINSFGYYKNQIDEFVNQKLGDEMIAFLLNHYRDKWKRKTGREVDFSFLQSN